LRRLMAGLRTMMERDGVDARRNILVGSYLAGRSIVNARTAVHHAVCHVLGANGVSHGIANTIMLPHVLQFNRSAVNELLGETAQAMDDLQSHGSPCDRIVGAIEALAVSGSLPRRLRDVGVPKDRLANMAD